MICNILKIKEEIDQPGSRNKVAVITYVVTALNLYYNLFKNSEKKKDFDLKVFQNSIQS